MCIRYFVLFFIATFAASAHSVITIYWNENDMCEDIFDSFYIMAYTLDQNEQGQYIIGDTCELLYRADSGITGFESLFFEDYLQSYSLGNRHYGQIQRTGAALGQALIEQLVRCAIKRRQRRPNHVNGFIVLQFAPHNIAIAEVFLPTLDVIHHFEHPHSTPPNYWLNIWSEPFDVETNMHIQIHINTFRDSTLALSLVLYGGEVLASISGDANYIAAALTPEQLPELPTTIVGNSGPLATTIALMLRPYILRQDLAVNGLNGNTNFRAVINDPSSTILPPLSPELLPPLHAPQPSLSSQFYSVISGFGHGVNPAVTRASDGLGNLGFFVRNRYQIISTGFSASLARWRVRLPRRAPIPNIGPSHPLYYQPHGGPPDSGGSSGSGDNCDIISI